MSNFSFSTVFSKGLFPRGVKRCNCVVKFSIWVRKHCGKKEKLLVTSNFSFSHSVFKRLVLQTCKNQGLFRKGLTMLFLSFPVVNEDSPLRCTMINNIYDISIFQFLLHYLKFIKDWFDPSTWDSVPITRTCWSILRDSYHSNLALRYRPQHIAIAIIYLAFLSHGLEVPYSKTADLAWWKVCWNIFMHCLF